MKPTFIRLTVNENQQVCLNFNFVAIYQSSSSRTAKTLTIIRMHDGSSWHVYESVSYIEAALEKLNDPVPGVLPLHEISPTTHSYL